MKWAGLVFKWPRLMGGVMLLIQDKYKMDAYKALSLSQSAQVIWTQHTILETAEAHIARLPLELAPQKASHGSDENMLGHRPLLSQDTYIATSLTHELNHQTLMQQACAAETAFVLLQADAGNKLCPPDEATEMEEPFDILTTIQANKETVPEKMEIVVITSNKDKKYLAQSIVKELQSQQSYAHACTSEAKYVQVKVRENYEEPSLEQEAEKHTTHNNVDFSRNIETVSIGTITDAKILVAVETNTEPRPLVDVGTNTIVNCLDVLRRAKEVEELNMLKADHLIIMKQLNEEKSQRMVAEHLVKIVQSDLSELRQRNVNEVTTRMKLENELSDAKVELTHVSRELTEREQRVKELEESLTGTSLLVRKLEEQNSISLMNRGGIDYMVQAKLAEGRAREAEQKLEVISAELLQAQTEVGVLLQRVSQSARDRTESVSSKVHTELLKIADERAAAAEQRTLELEKQLKSLKEQVPGGGSGGATVGVASSPLSYGLSYGSSYSSLLTTPTSLTSSGLSSTLYPSTSLGGLTSNSSLGYLSHDKPATYPPTSLYSSDTLSGTDYLNTSFKPKPSPPVAAKPTIDAFPKEEVELPSFADSAPPSSHVTSHVTKKEESGSSDWSSSDEDGDDPLLPSAHTSLISQWEWRSMNKTTPTTLDSSPPRKRPPPIAPKPKHIGPSRVEMTFEPPSSFNEPVRGPSLLSSKRVRGPRGRRLPVRFRTPPTLVT